jgi:CRISPR-associated protein Cmr6
MADKHPTQGFIPSFAVPSDTEKILTRDKAKLALECDNFSLLFHRYIPKQAITKDELIDDRGRTEKMVTVWWFEKILARFSPSNPTINDLIAGLTARWNARTRGTKKFPMILTSRMILGLGGKGPLEIGLTIDQITGLPYIPGSALKGLTRSYALYKIAEELGRELQGNEEDTKTLHDLDIELMNNQMDDASINLFEREFKLKNYPMLFGTQDAVGRAIFHDAILMGAPGEIYGMDVMTPHFKGWYNTGNSSKGAPTEAPHDADGPNPVVFLTVNAGCQFAFSVGWRGQKETDEDKQAHQFAKELLEAALQEFGIGSKTAAGYGAFVKPKPKA